MKRFVAFILVALLGWNVLLTIQVFQLKQETVPQTDATTEMCIRDRHWISPVMIYHSNW